MAEDRAYLLAIDVGTTTTRCVLFDLQGRPVGEAYREPPVRYPRPGWAEVAPEDWWTATVDVVHEALEGAHVPCEQILGVGLCGLKHAIVPVDAGGAPLGYAMLWMDQRCRAQAEWMTREHGALIEAALGRGPVMSTTPSAPKLRWIAENEPQLLRQTATFLLPKDFVRLRLTGTIATDPSDAGGTGLYDQRSGSWSRPLLALVGVAPDKMPPIRASTSVAGSITQQAAHLTGLAPGTPVVIGGGDVSCTLIGSDARAPLAPGAPIRACLYLGTAAWISTGRTLSAGAFGATATTGAALKWLSALCGSASAATGGEPSLLYPSLVEQAGGVPVGSNGLTFLPHLMGERGPTADPCAVGVLYGLSLAHGRAEIARAVLEGCACQLRRIIEALEVTVGELVTVGGGAKSRRWLQIIADVIGLPLLVPRVVEAGALGAAILAAVGIGCHPSVEEAAGEWVRIAGHVEPDAAAHAAYGDVYAAFLELERRVAPMYTREGKR
jgi:xylulokinase